MNKEVEIKERKVAQATPKRKNKNKNKVKKERIPSESRGEQSKSAYSAISKTIRIADPKMFNNGRFCTIRHRELIGNIQGSVNFSIQKTLILNPGLSASFPWLSPIANQWEKYRFNSLHFEYVPRCGTQTVGSILMVPEYDVLDPDPTDDLAAAQYDGSKDSAPWANNSCHLLTQRMHDTPNSRKLTRSGAVAGADYTNFDVGKFYLITSGMADTSTVGRLWVSYDVVLYIPQSSGSSSAQLGRASAFSAPYNLSQALGAQGSLIFGETDYNGLGISYDTVTHRFTFPPGTYMGFANFCTGNTSTTLGLAGINFALNGISMGNDDMINMSPQFGGQCQSAVSCNKIFTVTNTDYITVIYYASGNAGVTVVDSATVSFLLV